MEGASDVIYFEHVLRTIYKQEFEKIAITVQQYGGDAAAGIVKGTIDVSNITPFQKYILWTHDRDASPTNAPSASATKFKRVIETKGLKCHIFRRREIEYYYPEALHIAAQQGDIPKEIATINILRGDQAQKYRNAASAFAVCSPEGIYLKRLLKDYLTRKSHVPPEIRRIFEHTLLNWRNEVLGIH